MLGMSRSERAKLTYAYTPANWEADIQDVVVEECDIEVDPLGYRVTFCKAENDSSDPAYYVGASYLRNRLKKLNRAGFEAPMTKKAIALINKRRLIRIP